MNIKDLALKLKALADRGVGGERVNAEKKLRRLMDKYGITLEDLEGVERKPKIFEGVGKAFETLFAHVVWKVIPKCPIYGHKRRRTCMIVDVTDAEFIEIKCRYSIYKREFLSQMKDFTTAYVLKNGLGVDGDDDAKCATDTMSKEQRWRIANMMEGVKRVHTTKLIGDDN